MKPWQMQTQEKLLELVDRRRYNLIIIKIRMQKELESGKLEGLLRPDKTIR